MIRCCFDIDFCAIMKNVLQMVYVAVFVQKRYTTQKKTSG